MLPDNGTIERKMEIATYNALKDVLIKLLQDPDARASDIETVSNQIVLLKRRFEELEIKQLEEDGRPILRFKSK